MAKIRVFVNTGFVGARHEDVIEIDESELSGLDEAGRQSAFEEYAREYMGNCIEWGFQVLENNGCGEEA